MSKWTPEPWPENARELNGTDLLVVVGQERIKSGSFAGLANRQRAVACVNACAGMNDPAAEIERLRTISGTMQKHEKETP